MESQKRPWLPSFILQRKLSDHSECNPCNYPPENENEIVHLSGFALTAPGKIEQENLCD